MKTSNAFAAAYGHSEFSRPASRCTASRGSQSLSSLGCSASRPSTVPGGGKKGMRGVSSLPSLPPFAEPPEPLVEPPPQSLVPLEDRVMDAAREAVLLLTEQLADCANLQRLSETVERTVEAALGVERCTMLVLHQETLQVWSEQRPRRASGLAPRHCLSLEQAAQRVRRLRLQPRTSRASALLTPSDPMLAAAAAHGRVAAARRAAPARRHCARQLRRHSGAGHCGGVERAACPV